MDRISGLRDELLVKILSYLPTKDAVSTSILSKRWEFLWLWLPKLEYVCRQEYAHTESSDSESEVQNLVSGESESLQFFLDRSMPLHRAQVIESFRLDLWYPRCIPESVRMWLVIAVSRHLRELDITYHDYQERSNILPSSLYSCKSLVTLKLCGDILFDVPRMVCLPSLKTLHLDRSVRNLNGESLRRLLSVCPVLENLLVDLLYSYNTRKITVIAPLLLSLSLRMPREGDLDGLEIGTPSLKYLKLEDVNDESYPIKIENMPKLEDAYVDVHFHNISSLIGSITSVKRLTLCSMVKYNIGVVFNQLEHLKLCPCRACSWKLLARLLQDSPNLQVLDILKMDYSAPSPYHGGSDMGHWIQPSTIPECFLSSLQTFKWSEYFGRPQDISVAVYILKYARRLKTAEIWCRERFTPKFEMLVELSRTSRASTTCELLFY